MPVVNNSPYFTPPVPPTTVTFSPNGGSIQSLVIPGGVSSITIKMWGGGAGGGSWQAAARGGGAGYAEGTLAISGPVTLDVYVGESGKYSATGGLGGWPNGGKGGDGSFSNAGGGGGFSAIFPNGDFTTPYILAAGGGAAGTNDGFPGGGTAAWYSIGTFHGQPGTQSAGGAGGTTDGVDQIVAGGAGSFLTGGLGGTIVSGHGGGGGGAGYYGGGGGSAGDNSGFGATGGGASSYIGHVNLSAAQTIFNNTANRWHAANEADGDWPANAGRGGQQSTAGFGGYIVVTY